MTITVTARKAKGRKLQQWCCKQISRITNTPWGPDDEIASREMGQSGVDVRLSPKLRKLFPFSVEAKAQETWSVPAFVRQAQVNKYDNTEWLLIVKRNREKPLAVIDAELFFYLIENTSNLNLRQYIAERYNDGKGEES